MAFRVVKLGAGKSKVQLVLGRCKSGSASQGTQCENSLRDAPGATRCWTHRYEENEVCAEHDKRDCRKCPPRRI